MKQTRVHTVGVGFGIVIFVIAIFAFIVYLGAEDNPDTITLLYIHESGDGLWVDGDGELRIDSTEGCQIGEIRDVPMSSTLILRRLLLVVDFFIFLLGVVIIWSSIKRYERGDVRCNGIEWI